jgi:hypothetical protein
VSAVHPCSGVVVFPTTTHPARRSRETRIESVVAGGSAACSVDPNPVRKPAASSRSLTPIGMPARGPTSSPAAIRSESVVPEVVDHAQRSLLDKAPDES